MRARTSGCTTPGRTARLDTAANTSFPAHALPPAGLSSGEASDRLLRFGRNEALSEGSLGAWRQLALGFATPTSLLLWAAIAVEAAEAHSARGGGGLWADCAILGTLQLLNAGVAWREEQRAAGALGSLSASLRGEALVRRDGEVRRVDAAFLVPGDRVSLRAGQAVPADLLLQRGGPLQLDASTLTGESAPVEVRCGGTARMGCTVLRGEAEGVVLATGGATSWGRSAQLLSLRPAPSRLAGALGRVALALTACSLLLGLILYWRLLSAGESSRRAIAIAVLVACAATPVAMRFVCATVLALGARRLAGLGCLVRRLAALELLAAMDLLVCDKTGTLTCAQLQLAPEMPVFLDGVAPGDLLTAAALATRWWEPSADYLDALVLGAAEPGSLGEYEQLALRPFDAAARRSEATIRRPDGSTFRVAKGAPQALLELCANGPAVRQRVEAVVSECAVQGVRCLAVASCATAHDCDWLLLGILTFTDPLRWDAASACARAAQLGIEVKVLTGDCSAVAADTLRRLRLKGRVAGPEALPRPADVDAARAARAGREYGPLALSVRCFASVAPEHKFLLVEALRQSGHTVGFAGDGANDAPALRRADVGVAVCGATDAARAAADLLLTQPGLSPLLAAVLVARQMFARLRAYALFRVAASVQLLGFFAFAAFTVDPSQTDPAWPQYFALPVVALAVVTLTTDATVVAIAYDTAPASALPERWHLAPLFAVGAVMGACAAASTAALLAWGLQAAGGRGPLVGMLGGREDIYPRLQTAVYLKLALSNLLTVFAARTRSYCWTRAPAAALSATASLCGCFYSLLATNWPAKGGMAPIGGGLCLLVWLFALLAFAAQDAVKVVVYTLLADWGSPAAAHVEVPEAALSALTSVAVRRGEGDEGGLELRAQPHAGVQLAPGHGAARIRDISHLTPRPASPPTGLQQALIDGGGEARGVLAEGAPWLQGFETAMHEDYRTLASVFDWQQLLRSVAPAQGPARALDCGCGCGSFATALSRAGGLEGLSFTLDLLDPSQFALRVAAQRAAPPFRAGTAIQGRLQALDARAVYDIAWAVHSLYALPRADLRAALLRLVASVRHGGVVAIVQSAREGHLCRLHARLAQHRKGPGLIAAEDIEAELTAAGVRFRVADVGHTTAVPAGARELLEAYLQGCAVVGGAGTPPSLAEMQGDIEVGRYLRSQRDWDRRTYHFSQRVRLIFVHVHT